VLTVRTLSLALSKPSFAILLSCGLLALSVAAQVPTRRAPAQASTSASANATRYGLAVVDISYIFKHHKAFEAKMKGMKGDVDGAETLLKQERQAIAKRQEQLEALKSGTPDYKMLDEQVATAKAKFNVKASQQRKEFLDREARIYYDTYLAVNDAVKYYAQRHNLGLVVRFNGDVTDPSRREDVLRAINRPVVYQNAIDITPDVLQELNRSAATAARGVGVAAPRAATNHPIPGRSPRR
jgi:Skp family chaperone for outer membrane proteins